MNGLFIKCKEAYLKDQIWYFQYLQKQISEYGFIDYPSVVRDALGSLPKPLLDYQDIMSEYNLEKEALVAGYVLSVLEKEGQKGAFVILRLDINYQFVTAKIWPEAYSKMMVRGDELKKKIIIINGMIRWDRYAQENAIESLEDSEIIIID